MRPSCLRCAQISEQFLSWLFTDRVMIEQVAHNNKKMRRCQSDRQAGLFCILTGCICDLRVCEFGRLRPNFDRIRESNFLLLRESVATIKYCAPFFSFLFLTSRTCYSPQVDFLRVERLYCSQYKELKSWQRNECKWRLLLLRQPCTTSTQGSCSGESQRHTCESRYTRVSFHTHHWGKGCRNVTYAALCRSAHHKKEIQCWVVSAMCCGKWWLTWCRTMFSAAALAHCFCRSSITSSIRIIYSGEWRKSEEIFAFAWLFVWVRNASLYITITVRCWLLDQMDVY
jgi:hypothetical protein